MKRMKMGIVALVIAVLAISAVAVAAQTPSGTATPPAQGQTQGQPPAQGQGRPGRGQGMGMGGEFQVIADALGVDLATLRTDLQSGKTIADIAKEKNVELSTIVDAVVAKAQDNLKTAVTDGRLTQEQADAQIVLLKANLNALFTRKMDQQPGQGNRPGFGQGQQTNPVLDVIAKTLGVDAATLQTDLQGGKTIADIAKEKSVELSTVVDAVVAERQTALTTAVTDGKLTQEQADAQIALLKADLNARFSQKMDANGRGGFGFGGPMGGFGGPMGGFGGPMGGFGGPMGGFGGPMGPDGMGGFGGPGGRGHGGPDGNGGPMGPNGNAPIAPDATPEATAAANA